jgi:K(+)-stimulated pyrophosphate-energized sodium pump
MGNDKMNAISQKIQEGARAFLVTEYKYLSTFVFAFFCALLIIYSVYSARVDRTDGIRIGSSFVGGALMSGLSGWIGMQVATDANVRTTAAAQSGGLNKALRVALTGGAVMGFSVVGLSLVGISVFYYLMTLGRDGGDAAQSNMAVDSLAGFGFGASSIALFARVAGGIYTKAADVGADLVGKVESDLPEDDPRNPAVIADNVGDNVGDVAGMGADLFESFVGSIIATATLANSDLTLIALPFWIAGAGVIASFVGFFLVQTKDNAGQKELMHALHKGTLSAAFLQLVFSAIIVGMFYDKDGSGWKIFSCIAIGLASGICIGELTEFFTSYSFAPTRSITAAGVTGPATVIIQGLGVGMISVFPTLFVLVSTILACDALASDYGIAIAAVGMLSTLGIGLATDAYGPVADNAGGIAEMADLPESVRATTDALDALGNTTAATGKGFAIGSAVLTSLSLMTAFTDVAEVTDLNISDPVVLSGVVFGATLPMLFAALTMLSVQKAAGSIILEVRRQFAEIDGLKEGRPGVEADSNTCVAIATKASVEEMVLPGSCAIAAPLIVGFLVGPRCLVGMLGGAISSGAAIAVMMANAGGAWDNSKKYVEIEKAYGGKGTATHKACVVGDTVGDPFKDTSGPSLNILLKLSSLLSLVIAPLIAGNDDWENFYYGFIPIVLLAGAATYCYVKFWSQGPVITHDMIIDNGGPPLKHVDVVDVPLDDETKEAAERVELA